MHLKQTMFAFGLFFLSCTVHGTRKRIVKSFSIGFHGIIHTFKNYFLIIFLTINF